MGWGVRTSCTLPLDPPLSESVRLVFTSSGRPIMTTGHVSIVMRQTQSELEELIRAYQINGVGSRSEGKNKHNTFSYVL